MHAEMVGHWQRGEWVPYSRLNRQIHEEIFRIAGNATLAGLYQNLMVRIHACASSPARAPSAGPRLSRITSG